VRRSTLAWLLVGVQGLLLIGLVVVPHRQPSLLSLLVGLLLVACAIVMAAAASRRLGSALTPTPVPRAQASLRTDGPYRWVRHPIYSAIILGAIGWVVALGSPATLIVALVLTAFLVAKSRWEDRLLAEAYGQPWRDWAASTGALLPRRQSSSRP
jgi:protein-S-isoprenylcysteine O-methyltransferase Ste14